MAENDKFIKNEKKKKWCNSNSTNKKIDREKETIYSAAMTKTHKICELCARFLLFVAQNAKQPIVKEIM